MRSDAADARDELRALRTELDAESLLEGDGIDGPERVRRRGSRRSATACDSPLLAPVRWLPVAGRQLSAASHQADAAATGLQAAADLGGELQGLVDRGLGSGPDRVATLREVAATVRSQSSHLRGPRPRSRRRARRALWSDARARSRRRVAEVARRARPHGGEQHGLADFFEGPSDYLLLAANNAQMQNGQGMFLSAGVLHVEDGRMDLGPMESLEKVPDVVPAGAPRRRPRGALGVARPEPRPAPPRALPSLPGHRRPPRRELWAALGRPAGRRRARGRSA